MEIFLNVIDSLFNMVRSEIQLSFLELDDLEEHLRLANRSQLCQIRRSVFPGSLLSFLASVVTLVKLVQNGGRSTSLTAACSVVDFAMN